MKTLAAKIIKKGTEKEQNHKGKKIIKRRRSHEKSVVSLCSLGLWASSLVGYTWTWQDRSAINMDLSIYAN